MAKKAVKSKFKMNDDVVFVGGGGSEILTVERVFPDVLNPEEIRVEVRWWDYKIRKFRTDTLSQEQLRLATQEDKDY